MNIRFKDRIVFVEVERTPSVVDWFASEGYFEQNGPYLTNDELLEVTESDAFQEACMEEAMEGGYRLD